MKKLYHSWSKYDKAIVPTSGGAITTPPPATTTSTTPTSSDPGVSVQQTTVSGTSTTVMEQTVNNITAKVQFAGSSFTARYTAVDGRPFKFNTMRYMVNQMTPVLKEWSNHAGGTSQFREDTPYEAGDYILITSGTYDDGTNDGWESRLYFTLPAKVGLSFSTNAPARTFNAELSAPSGKTISVAGIHWEMSDSSVANAPIAAFGNVNSVTFSGSLPAAAGNYQLVITGKYESGESWSVLHLFGYL